MRLSRIWTSPFEPKGDFLMLDSKLTNPSSARSTVTSSWAKQKKLSYEISWKTLIRGTIEDARYCIYFQVFRNALRVRSIKDMTLLKECVSYFFTETRKAVSFSDLLVHFSMFRDERTRRIERKVFSDYFFALRRISNILRSFWPSLAH